MIPFHNLSKELQIEAIKDCFMIIFKNVVNNPDKLKDYVGEQSEEYFAKTKEYLSKIGKRKGCMCGTCINLSVITASIPLELELLIDAAKKEAQDKMY